MAVITRDRPAFPPAADRGSKEDRHIFPALSKAVGSPWLHLAALALCVAAPTLPAAAAPPVLAGLDALYPSLDALYIDLHRNPELSLHEERTAAKMAERLRTLGFEVTEHVGGHGVVGVLRNGKGPVVLLRTDMDALPVEEKTGLPYASTVTVKDDAGATVPVMHACGHDIHMTSWVGAATLLAGARNRWTGTLVLVGQPAEEVARGAASMLQDGFLSRFPHPEFAVAIHDWGDFPAGKVAYTTGYVLANVDTVELFIYGKGGHGARPQAAVDPIVIAARTVTALQTIVARELNPRDPAVVTVGSIHGGTKSNIIPDEVKLQLTVRSYKPEVQKHLLAAIERIAKGEAAAAGAPREPRMVVDPLQSAQSLYNDPALTSRLAKVFGRAFGEENVVPFEPQMVSEDFGAFGRAAGAPSVMFFIGASNPEAFAKARAAGTVVPNVHSPLFAPDRERTIRTGVTVLTLSALDLLRKP